MKIISIILVALGIGLLTYSLFPARAICLKERRINRGWKFLGLLIALFVVGYLFYIFKLSSESASTLKLIVSLILFGGSVFVVMVVRLSLRSLQRIEEFADQERHRALHDQLTELPNRWLLQERLDYAILQAKRRQETIAVLSIDLNRFKEINDSLGHFYGDYLLQEVACRFAKVMRESDTLSRFGGDEFAVILPDTNVEQAVRVCRKISTMLDQPFIIEGHNLNVGASIGIVMYPEHGQDSETLIQYSDIAMYEAKRSDVLYAVFETGQDESTWKRLILIGELRNALAKEEFVLFYQPKVSVKEKHMAGVEALVRWQHPERGLIPPDEFIHLVEQAGLSKLLTNLVLDTALKQKAIWDKAGTSMTMSVNLSVKNLHDLEFPKDVERLLTKWKAKPSQLFLEITESSMLVDPARVNKVVARLKNLGINLSIDDYGTGYSSLSYLRKFPAKEIKIDKSLITDMVTNEENAVIVKSTIDMIHNIGCVAVAEGVEDKETLEMLEGLGCDLIQGFHICKPLSVNMIDSWFGVSSWTIKKSK